MVTNEWVIEQIRIHSEEKFRTFTMRLMPGVENVYGVRLPVLRKLAKTIIKDDWRSYLDSASDESYEEIMLQGMVIGCAPMELSELFARIDRFVVKIDNWTYNKALQKITESHQVDKEVKEYIRSLKR